MATFLDHWTTGSYSVGNSEYYIYINDIGGITGKYEPIVIFHGYVKYIDICKRI